MRISTKKGDHGETGLFNGKQVKKSDPVVKILGELDELNSFLGFAKAGAKDVYVSDSLNRIQKDIYKIMSVAGNEMKPPKNVDGVTEEDVARLKKDIERVEGAIGKILKFSIPGESELSARIHLARVACRRAEREVTEHKDHLKIPPAILKYLNRLSDLLFLLAHEYE